MDQQTGQAWSGRQLRHLTFAVWALVLVMLLNTGVVLVTNLLPAVLADRIHEALPDLDPIAFSHSDEYKGFHSWPLEKQIESASVILVTVYRREGGKLKGMISEFLKRDPGVTFYYEVGDEYGYEEEIRPDTRYGEGQIVLLTGSPATMRAGLPYYNGRILGLGDMPLDELRKIIAEQR